MSRPTRGHCFFGPAEPDGPRFGLQLADARKVIVQRLGEMKPFVQRPERPILRPRSCWEEATDRALRCGCGPCRRRAMTFVCAWPAEGVEETSAEIDAGVIFAAAPRGGRDVA